MRKRFKLVQVFAWMRRGWHEVSPFQHYLPQLRLLILTPLTFSQNEVLNRAKKHRRSATVRVSRKFVPLFPPRHLYASFFSSLAELKSSNSSTIIATLVNSPQMPTRQPDLADEVQTTDRFITRIIIEYWSYGCVSKGSCLGFYRSII